MLAGVFPLITDAMFHRMTFSGASSFLGAVAALLTVVPWVLVFFGTRIRARSNFAKVFTPIPPPSSLNFFEYELIQRDRKLWQHERFNGPGWGFCGTL